MNWLSSSSSPQLQPFLNNGTSFSSVQSSSCSNSSSFFGFDSSEVHEKASKILLQSLPQRRSTGSKLTFIIFTANLLRIYLFFRFFFFFFGLGLSDRCSCFRWRWILFQRRCDLVLSQYISCLFNSFILEKHVQISVWCEIWHFGQENIPMSRAPLMNGLSKGR